MKRIPLLFALAAALALPAALPAASRTDGTLSIKKGHGTIVLKLQPGTVIGRMASGTVKIRDVSPYDGPPPELHHCRRLRYVNRTTAVCSGRKLTFRALDGRFVVNLKGSGIFLSAVGRGSVTTLGAGDPNVPNGLISLDNGPYQPISDLETIYTLGTPTP